MKLSELFKTPFKVKGGGVLNLRGFSKRVIDKEIGGGENDVSGEYKDNECLGFTAIDGSVNVSLQNYQGNAPIVYYKKEDQDWTLWDYAALNIAEGETIRFYGENDFSFSKSSGKYSTFVMSGDGKINANGNCDSLVSKQKYGIIGPYCFYNLFKNCSSLITSPKLDSNYIDSSCYYGMFQNCTSLIEVPNLPAKKLADSCYRNMFDHCTSLTKIPELPAKKLESNCYNSMFSYCTSLIDANIILGDFVESSCCNAMFSGCSSLQEPPQLPALKLKYGCYQSMFSYCSSLTKTPNLPATILDESCYQAMFLYSNISSPVELPALNLANYCYNRMFESNSNLNYIKALFLTVPGSNYTGEWVKQIAATGTFVKNSQATWNVSGANGVPEGWTVETADN